MKARNREQKALAYLNTPVLIRFNKHERPVKARNRKKEKKRLFLFIAFI